MPQKRQVDAGLLESGVVYEIEFACSTPGPEVEEGALTSYWTGKIDTWGKFTINSVNQERTVYLFSHEFISMERVA